VNTASCGNESPFLLKKRTLGSIFLESKRLFKPFFSCSNNFNAYSGRWLGKSERKQFRQYTSPAELQG
jgi:hypothetical protein